MQILRNYVFGHNETHLMLDLDYGSIINHHESANARASGDNDYMYYLVRVQWTSSHVLKLYTMNTCAHKRHMSTATPKATKDIEAGQEIFIRYGPVDWFESKNIPYADVDYARTMWRPDLHPLPCRKLVRLITAADGRNSFAVLDNLLPGTVMEMSLCVEVSAIVIDQFPHLWDFVITGEILNECIFCLLPKDFYLLTPPVFL